MKKLLRATLIATGVVLFFALMLALGRLNNPKLTAELSDGTRVTIEHWAITANPQYFPEPSGLSRLLKQLRGFFSGGVVISYSSSSPPSDPVLFVRYSLSNPERGFYPGGGKGQGFHSSESSSSAKEVWLLDEDGVRYARSTRGKRTEEGDTALYLEFQAYNNTSRRYRLYIRFPGEKEPVHFDLENKQALPVPPVPMDAKTLPITLNQGHYTATITEVSRRARGDWTVRMKFNDTSKTKTYGFTYQWLQDNIGGRHREVSPRASAWILSGETYPSSEAAALPEDRQVLENLACPQPQTTTAVPLPAQGKLAEALLLGAGVYVFNDGILAGSGGVDDEEDLLKLHRDYMDKRTTGSTRGYFSTHSSKEKAGAFFWRQTYFSSGFHGSLFVKTDRPIMLLRPKGDAEGRYLLRAGKSPQQVRMRDSRWEVWDVDWKNPAEKKTVHITRQTETPYEVHIIPTEEMRKQVPLEKWE